MVRNMLLGFAAMVLVPLAHGVALAQSKDPVTTGITSSMGGVIGGYAWRVPDKLPPKAVNGFSVRNMYINPQNDGSGKIPGNSVDVPTIDSGLRRGTDGTWEFSHSLQRPTVNEHNLSMQGYNVAKFGLLSAEQFKNISDFYTLAQDPSKPGVGISLYRDDGLVAIPNKDVAEAAQRMSNAVRNKADGRILPDYPEGGNYDPVVDAALLCDYLATNQELNIVRNYVTNEDLSAKLDAAVTDPSNNKNMNNFIAAWGLRIDFTKLGKEDGPMAPTKDELQGLIYLRDYFEVREGKEAQINPGEKAAGQYLLYKETGDAFNMLRYGATNDRPLPLTPPEKKLEESRIEAVVKNATESTFNWENAAGLVSDTLREKYEGPDRPDDPNRRDDPNNGEGRLRLTPK